MNLTMFMVFSTYLSKHCGNFWVYCWSAWFMAVWWLIDGYRILPRLQL